MFTVDLDAVFIDRMQSELNKYIWSHKQSVLMGSLSQGVLGSIDVAAKYKALKIPWIQLIFQGKGWNDIILEYLKPLGGIEFLVRYNYDTNCSN